MIGNRITQLHNKAAKQTMRHPFRIETYGMLIIYLLWQDVVLYQKLLYKESSVCCSRVDKEQHILKATTTTKNNKYSKKQQLQQKRIQYLLIYTCNMQKLCLILSFTFCLLQLIILYLLINQNNLIFFSFFLGHIYIYNLKQILQIYNIYIYTYIFTIVFQQKQNIKRK